MRNEPPAVQAARSEVLPEVAGYTCYTTIFVTPFPSCPALRQASTPCFLAAQTAWMAGTSPAMTSGETESLRGPDVDLALRDLSELLIGGLFPLEILLEALHSAERAHQC